MRDTKREWYRVGHAGVVRGSTEVEGDGSKWTDAGIAAGDVFYALDKGRMCEIADVKDDTHLVLFDPWPEDSDAALNYAVIRNFTGSMQADIAARLVALLETVEAHIDLELQQIRGYSAYEVAVQNGFTGSEAEFIDWLRQGPKGAAGANGKSAYELARDAGFTGTLEDYLESLKGTAGANGKSAYQLAQDAGFTGTLMEFISSLRGEPGKSAYELDRANGFRGTLREWLGLLRESPRRLYAPPPGPLPFGPFAPPPGPIPAGPGPGPGEDEGGGGGQDNPGSSGSGGSGKTGSGGGILLDGGVIVDDGGN